jgi:hypothetical protein
VRSADCSEIQWNRIAERFISDRQPVQPARRPSQTNPLHCSTTTKSEKPSRLGCTYAPAERIRAGDCDDRVGNLFLPHLEIGINQVEPILNRCLTCCSSATSSSVTTSQLLAVGLVSAYLCSGDSNSRLRHFFLNSVPRLPRKYTDY